MTHTATSPIAHAASPTEPGQPARSLAHLPVTLFASIMGLGGLSLAWRRAANATSCVRFARVLTAPI